MSYCWSPTQQALSVDEEIIHLNAGSQEELKSLLLKCLGGANLQKLLRYILHCFERNLLLLSATLLQLQLLPRRLGLQACEVLYAFTRVHYRPYAAVIREPHHMLFCHNP
eukprot:2607-Heterococcus_DN1.PRE.5